MNSSSGLSPLERERLLALLNYTRESVRLKATPAADVTRQSAFCALESQLNGLPGIALNVAADDEELWLRVERLKETPAPAITDAVLATLTELTNDPSQSPRLRPQLPAQTLLRLGLLPEGAAEEPDYNPLTPVPLATLPQAAQLTADLAHYQQQQWQPWALEETRRRRTIGWYSRLYALKQQLDGGLADAPLELVWGVGVAAWQLPNAEVRYPVLTRLAELTLNPHTMALEVRPREATTRLETDVYAAHEVPGVAGLEQGSRPLLAEAPYLSPFEAATYEPVLRQATALLDAQGRYLPDEPAAAARSVPAATPQLQLTDTWVLFARPRSANAFLQDLEALRTRIEALTDELPPAVAALVREPASYHTNQPLPAFRGLSLVGDAGAAAPQELYFPLPFNDEQVRIVQLLEHAPGVVVQGPPGTGKTHTIANVICHYLALGKRVLVTSMRDPALGVLRDKLPASVRPLAISLLTSEREGLRQFEHAVQHIAEQVQRLDRDAARRHIGQLTEQLDGYHSRLAYIDRRMAEWGRQNLEAVVLDEERLQPHQAAREVVEAETLAEWLPDALTPAPLHRPQFDEAAVTSLRAARLALGADLDYRAACLPAVAALPEPRELLLTHQQLSRSLGLQEAVATGELPALAHVPDALTRVTAVLQQLSNLAAQQLKLGQLPWAAAQTTRLAAGTASGLYSLLEALGAELQQALAARQQFLPRPVRVPAGLELEPELLAAVAAQARGERPFGLLGVFGKTAQKQRLSEIKVLTGPPASAADWAYVASYLDLLRRMHELAARWQALAPELGLPALTQQDPLAATTEARQLYEVYEQVRDAQTAEAALRQQIHQLLPAWALAHPTAAVPVALPEAAAVLRQHQLRLQLETAWAVRQQYETALHNTSGRISEALRRFFEQELGNPAVADADLQTRWGALTQELRRVHDLQPLLNTVTAVTEQIAASGAPLWAARLQTEPALGAPDELLPNDWRQRWRLRRLATFLANLDGRAELRQLATERREAEKGLALTYQELINQRTWLQLAQNATPQVRSALEAYRNAITKIGKGTGKKAGRYRLDAQRAAAQANAAIPCWIMPHYRVSESLPAELGAFDLVIVDEASQSDLTALPALLRARKILVVGDDKQVSPEGIGLEEEKIRGLMARFLTSQVSLYAPQLAPDRSIYDLFKVVFAEAGVMLKEHFRCVGPIIEYSKREFYNHEIRPLRLPSASERLDPPLIDVLVEDGVRRQDTNPAEARFIVDEIKRLLADPAMAGRTLGVVSLLADKQARLIWDMLEQEIGLEAMLRHELACGDARTFQGKERDVIFLSLVVSKGQATAVGRDDFAKRFNVAASRARDRMYLVRSLEADELSPNDRLRRGLLAHFATPYGQDEARVSNLRDLCESAFEQDVYDVLTERGYRVQPQVRVGQYRIDLVVEGAGDQRLAVECDGDQYHGPDRWADDLRRQRVLERAGWQFWRCFASAWVRWRAESVQDLLRTLTRLGIEPLGAQAAAPSRHVEARRYVAFPEVAEPVAAALPMEAEL
ncbi:AAA domain-containing protein [Hymenobacter latericus]|uniref:AAA domain-containing protein n=1 Tax=Hymenobacter sp. YIM 151858-1 TaxID=2987688 RepID=UPI002227132B|nr:AAA domain-containing protein [Hymenobacter sp. YIM 151858-1]UYZ58484.1 AAA domain-containing protein [Hymenobacter sp. YIM 151858-1]